MKSHTRHILTTSIVLGVLAVGAGVFIWSGLYNIGADDPHWMPTRMAIENLRERSIAARMADVQVPNLDDPRRIAVGAVNYSAMCTGCHLAPGITDSEIRPGLYPIPPNLSQLGSRNDKRTFWIIKHGIKASGMPAWGKSMSDDYIWNMVAFLQQLPGMDAARYQALVASSGGHDHGGGETKPHGHAEGVSDDHDAPETAMDVHAGMDMSDDQPAAAEPSPNAAPESVEHRHADGTVESHPAPPTQPPPAKAADGHDHQH